MEENKKLLERLSQAKPMLATSKDYKKRDKQLAKLKANSTQN